MRHSLVFIFSALAVFACSCSNPSYTDKAIRSSGIWPDDTGTPFMEWKDEWSLCDY